MTNETSPPASPSKIAIIVDDEPANRDFLVRLVAQAQYQTHGAGSGQEAMSIIQSLSEAPLVIIVDSELPDLDGLSLVKNLRLQFPQTKIIMATMHDNLSLIHQAFEGGCDAFIVKPHGFMELFKRLQQLPSDASVLERLIFDKYGVRHFKTNLNSSASPETSPQKPPNTPPA